MEWNFGNITTVRIKHLQINPTSALNTPQGVDMSLNKPIRRLKYTCPSPEDIKACNIAEFTN